MLESRGRGLLWCKVYWVFYVLCGFLRIWFGLSVKFVGALYSRWVLWFWLGIADCRLVRVCWREKFWCVWCKVSGCNVLDLVEEFLFEMAPIQENGYDQFSSPCWTWLQLVKMAMPKLHNSGHWLSWIVGVLQLVGVTGGAGVQVTMVALLYSWNHFTELPLER